MASENSNKSFLTVDDLRDSLKLFGTADYAVFITMLVCCLMIGLYFGYQDHRKAPKRKCGEETSEYLMGGRNMPVFPIGMSLVASMVSGITLLGKQLNLFTEMFSIYFYHSGTSTEIYLYGTQYCYVFISIIISAFVMHHTIIPVFHDLQITSTYEYLQMRFDRNVRLFGSTMFALSQIMIMPIVS